MISRLVFLLFCGHIALTLENAEKLPRVKRQSLKVQINATDDTVCMKYLRPSQNTKLEGFVLGYGSSFFSNQYIPLPSEGKTYITELDAEPRYLVSVRPARNSNNKKSCSGRTKTQKPLQLVVGTLTPTSVFLSWGILVNPQHDWTATSNCASDRFYTVRYREKDKEKKWVFQLCPVTETVVDNLKPNTLYEFGVKDNIEDSIWSKTFNHKTVLSNKKVNGQLQNMYKLVPNTQTQLTLRDNKKLVPVTIIKQVIQNRTLSKTPDSSSLPGAILVHLVVPGLNETQQKLPPLLTIDDISQASKKKIAKNETRAWPAESKTPEVQEISPQSLPAETEKNNGPEEFKSTPKPELAQTQSILASNEIQPLPPGSRISDAPKSPLTELASHGFLHVTSTPQTFATPEISDTAKDTAELEISVPVITTEPHFLEMAMDETKPLSSRSKTSGLPEMLPISAASRRPRLKSTSLPSLATQQTVKAAPDFLQVTSTFQTSASAEMSETETAADEIKPVSSRSTTSGIPETASTKSAPAETQFIPTQTKTSPQPEQSHSKSVSEPITFRIEPPRSTIAPKETQHTPSKPKPSPKLHIPQAKDVLESVTFRTDQPKTAIVPKETHRVPSKPKTSPSSEVPQTKPAPRETRRGPSKPKTSPSPHVPPTRASPKESQRVSSKPKASPSPDVSQTKPVLAPITFTVEKPKATIAPKEPQHTPFKPKAAPIPDAPYSKPEIILPFHEPVTTMIPHIPERTKATLAPTEKQFIPTKPKTSAKPRVPHTKPAPKETLHIPSKPKTSVGPEVPQTKLAPRTTHLGSINLITVHVVDGSKMTLVPNETYQLSPKTKSALATEIPQLKTAPHKIRLTSARPKPSDKLQTRPAVSRTTLAPARTKTLGLPKGIVPATGRDDVYTPEDIVKLIGVDVEKPMEYSDTWEKMFSVTTSPGPHRPPVPPVKPTQMRRRPLPPNTVTGKPGSPAKPAGPTTLVKTGVPYKTPTASATPDYYVDATVFSSSPTSETDSSGKPRYQAPHVKYMKKDDDVPCSITSSLEHFPQEEGGSKEEATHPPQNPPTNLTVVTVEGCPTFVILDWEKPDNDTVTEYEVVSTENGGIDGEKEQSIITTNQTHSTVENLKPDTSYEFHVKPRNPLGEGPSSNVVAFSTESADPRVSEPISMGKDAIWTEIPFNSDTFSECKGKQYVKRTWYKKFVGVQLCNSLRYKIYLSDSLTGKFYNIGDQRGHGEDHCQFVDSFLDGRTGQQEDLPVKDGFFRAVRQEPVKFGKIGGETQINYVRWYECGTSIPGKW
uniref:ABI family member 3 binding protein n=1 Tax=Dromaius novaehollandiae TaxID=8790 RepID=A0A8C4JJZ4_DRONO